MIWTRKGSLTTEKSAGEVIAACERYDARPYMSSFSEDGTMRFFMCGVPGLYKGTPTLKVTAQLERGGGGEENTLHYTIRPSATLYLMLGAGLVTFLYIIWSLFTQGGSPLFLVVPVLISAVAIAENREQQDVCVQKLQNIAQAEEPDDGRHTPPAGLASGAAL